MTQELQAPDQFPVPDLCPACSGPVTVRGDFLYCDSRACPEKLSGSVRVWVRNLGLLHIGDSTIDALTDPSSPSIASVADLYRLDLDAWESGTSGPKMAQKCHASLHANKELPLELILASLNIPNFGLSTATDFVQAGFDTVDKALAAGFDDLVAIPNIGEKTARFIQEGLLLRRDLLLDLATVLTVKRPVGGVVAGKKFCITLELSRPRKAVEKMIMDAGGIPKGSVSKDTSYLVTNFPEASSSKITSARKHGVPVISEQELYSLLGVS